MNLPIYSRICYKSPRYVLWYSICVILFLGMVVLYGKKERMVEPYTNTSIHTDSVRNVPPVYCLMVTGYTSARIPYARASVRNFSEQTYSNKHLVVLNQAGETVLTDDEHTRDNMIEFFVDKRGKTLGELRNISLQFVPPDAVWTTWDDDDWRAPSYISTMLEAMHKHDTRFIMFMNRIEYNRLNSHAFRLTLRSGLMTFFARQHPGLLYAHVDTSEDRPLKEYARTRLKPFVLDNDPKLYVRLIHDDNTSVYIDKDRSHIRDTTKNKDFFERELNDEEQALVGRLSGEYFKAS